MILIRVDAVDTAQLDATAAAFWFWLDCSCRYCQIAVVEEDVYIAFAVNFRPLTYRGLRASCRHMEFKR